MSASQAEGRIGFRAFYRDVFLPEHRSAANIALHILGVLLSAAVVAYAIGTAQYWYLLAYPIVHALPGLIGHRLFERNAAVGDVRLNRRDHPLVWFIVGNHMMTIDVLFGGMRWVVTLLVLAGLVLGAGAVQHALGDRTVLSAVYLDAVAAARGL